MMGILDSWVFDCVKSRLDNVGVSNPIQANEEAVNKDEKSNCKTVRSHNPTKRWVGRKDKGGKSRPHKTKLMQDRGNSQHYGGHS